MKIFVKEQLSEHKYKTPQGYLICTDAIIARTGKQTYKKSTFFPDAADAEADIEVDRHEKDVFDEATMASFENMPITIDHPQEEVNSTNNKKYSVGYVRDVHKGEFEGKPVMKANLVFTDDEAIRKIENGEMIELSCGYDCDVKDEHNPYQENIRGNHVALCQRGRAGIARIQDSVEVKDATMTCKVGADYDERQLPWFERKFKIKAEPIFRGGEIVAVKFTGTREQLDKLWEYGYDAPINDSVEDANKPVEHLISYFNAWGYPVGRELQEVVNYYKMSKSDVDKVFGPRIGRTYEKSELEQLHTYDSVEDALVQNQQELDFIKNAKQIRNAGGKIFVMKNDDEGYCSFDGGKTWYSGNVRILPERDGGRKQESRWLRVAAMGHEGVISLAKLKYASQYGEIPQGYEVDHLNANHMDDRMSNYQLVSSAENQLRNKVRIAARRQQDTQGYVSRSAIANAFGKQQLDLLERYNDYDRFTFKDSIKDESEEHKSLRRALKNVRVDTRQEMKQLLVDLINDKFMNYSPEVRQLKKTIESIIRWSDNLQEARDTIFRIAKEEHVIDSIIDDALVDEPNAWSEMKSAIQAKGYRFDKEGKTLFGRHHLEFTSNNVIGEQNFRNECIKLANEVDRIERKYNTPSTYNFGLQQDGKIHAVVDIDKKYVKDEMPDVVKTALKMVKSIKH